MILCNVISIDMLRFFGVLDVASKLIVMWHCLITLILIYKVGSCIHGTEQGSVVGEQWCSAYKPVP